MNRQWREHLNKSTVLLCHKSGLVSIADVEALLFSAPYCDLSSYTMVLFARERLLSSLCPNEGSTHPPLRIIHVVHRLFVMRQQLMMSTGRRPSDYSKNKRSPKSKVKRNFPLVLTIQTSAEWTFRSPSVHAADHFSHSTGSARDCAFLDRRCWPRCASRTRHKGLRSTTTRC